MLYYLTQFNTQVDVNLQGVAASEVSSDDRDEKIVEALLDYSRQKPKRITIEITGDAGQYYPICDVSEDGGWAGTSGSLYAEWVEGFSQVLEIEYPAADISLDEDPEYLHRYGWDDNFRDANNDRWLWFVYDAPSTTETFRVRYTTPYIFSGSPTGVNLPRQDFYAVCQKAASLCCSLLATRYGQFTRSTYDIESINYLTKAEEYRREAANFQTEYERRLGIPRLGRSRAGGIVRRLPVKSSLHGSRGTLFHDY